MDCNPDIPPIPSKGKLGTRAFMESCGRTFVNYPSVVLSLGLFFLWSVFESVVCHAHGDNDTWHQHLV